MAKINNIKIAYLRELQFNENGIALYGQKHQYLLHIINKINGRLD